MQADNVVFQEYNTENRRTQSTLISLRNNVANNTNLRIMSSTIMVCLFIVNLKRYWFEARYQIVCSSAYSASCPLSNHFLNQIFWLKFLPFLRPADYVLMHETASNVLFAAESTIYVISKNMVIKD